MSRTLRITLDGDEGTALPVPDDVTASDEDLIRALRGEKDVPGFDMTASLMREKFELRVREGVPEEDADGYVMEPEWVVVGNRLDGASIIVERDGVPFLPEVIVQFTVAIHPGTDPQAAADGLFQVFADAYDDEEKLPGIASVTGYHVVTEAQGNDMGMAGTDG